MQRFGQFKNAVHPGLNYYNPFSEEIRSISLKTKVLDMPKQSIYTKDNMGVWIDTALFYRIIDPFRATYVVRDIVSSLLQINYVTLRTICG